MLDLFGSGHVQTCRGVTRRSFLQAGTLAAIGLSLPRYLWAKEQGAVDSQGDRRSAIMIFNLGGPSHLDTFDPKPDAPAEYRGPFRSINTRSLEIQISELLPRTAQVADQLALVRSCYHTGPAVHDAGWQIMQTGRTFAGGVRSPHAGAAAAYLTEPHHDLPAHVVLPETMGRGGGNLPSGQTGGFLGSAYDPFSLHADPARSKLKISDWLAPPEIGPVRLEQGRRLRAVVDDAIKHFEARDEAQLRDRNVHDAYQLLTSTRARAAFDLSQESKQVRERYGRHRFGQCCLLARRLIEAGVRFVTINTFLTVFNEITWDIHGSKPFTTIDDMRRIVAPMYDQAYSALIEDLSQRGLLGETLVCNLAEFGRTPKINAAGGRDHWPHCFTVGFAGGGVQGGRVIGASDALGGAPTDRPAPPGDVLATIFHSLGFDLTTQLPGPAGKPIPLVDSDWQPIQELF